VDREPKTGVERRAFLKTLGLGAVGAATVAPLVGEAKETAQEREKPRYQVTDHVKRFYKLNRL